MPNYFHTTRLLAGALALVAAAACSDMPSAPSTSPAAPSFSKSGGSSTSGGSGSSNTSASSVVSQRLVGDTTVTVFVVGTNASTSASFDIGNTSRIDFPYSVASVCDPATSSYGPGTWDSACAPARQSVTVTAKSWVNAQGKLSADFEPALRFVPNLRKAVTIYLRDATLAPTTHIDYCTALGCVDEAATDPSLATKLDAHNGFAYRTIKHFSGYTVTADRSDADVAW